MLLWCLTLEMRFYPTDHFLNSTDNINKRPRGFLILKLNLHWESWIIKLTKPLVSFIRHLSSVSSVLSSPKGRVECNHVNVREKKSPLHSADSSDSGGGEGHRARLSTTWLCCASGWHAECRLLRWCRDSVQGPFQFCSWRGNVELPEEMICRRAHGCSASPRSHTMLMQALLLFKKPHKYSSRQDWSKPHE